MFNVSYLVIYIIITIHALWLSLYVIGGTPMMTQQWHYDPSLLQRSISLNEDNKMALYSPWDQAKYIREKQYIERMHHVYLGCGITCSLIGGTSMISFTKAVENSAREEITALSVAAWNSSVINHDSLDQYQVLYKIYSCDVSVNFGLLMTVQPILKCNVFFLEGQASSVRTDLIKGNLADYSWKPFTCDVTGRIIVGVGKTFELPKPFIVLADWSAVFLCVIIGKPQTSSYVLTRSLDEKNISDFWKLGRAGNLLSSADFMVLNTRGQNELSSLEVQNKQFELLFKTPIAMNWGGKIIFIKDQKIFSLTVIFDFRMRYFLTNEPDDDVQKQLGQYNKANCNLILNLKNSKFTYVTLWLAISWLV